VFIIHTHLQRSHLVSWVADIRGFLLLAATKTFLFSAFKKAFYQLYLDLVSKENKCF
jgi:hypothetical protein